VEFWGVAAAGYALLLGPLWVDVFGYPVAGTLAVLGEPLDFLEVHLYSSPSLWPVSG
jgi:hypothetical protein